MASSADYLDFILEQLPHTGEITHRAMMGEYILYINGRVFGGIYDDRFLVKPTKSAKTLMPNARYELPYEGAKEMLMVDNVEDSEFLAQLLDAMYPELPEPKAKKNEVNIMPRPTNKKDLMELSQANFEKLLSTADSMSDKARITPFDFSGDKSRKEAHWKRDKDVRDVFVHLYEWHQLLLNWVNSNMEGNSVPLLPEPYNWKTYGDMNMEFWKKHRDTSPADARAMLENSHRESMELLEKFTDEELFTRGHFPWTGNNALGSYFAANMSSHYDWALKKLRSHIRKIGFEKA